MRQDYRGQLGLVSLARRDFQELSDIFADTEALQKKDGRTADRRSRATQESQFLDYRIVLFVDDLDRCQPEKVVRCFASCASVTGLPYLPWLSVLINGA